MNIHADEISPFIEKFVETKDWATWFVLADFLTERGEEIGARAAIWIGTTKRMPHLLYPESQEDCFQWWGPGTVRAKELPSCNVGAVIDKLMAEHHNDLWFFGGKMSDCYLVLIDCYCRREANIIARRNRRKAPK